MAEESIELIINNNQTNITKKNYSESLKKISESLELGTPILIEKYFGVVAPLGGINDKTHHLIISNGHIDEKGTFYSENGARNQATTRIIDNNQFLSHTPNEKKDESQTIEFLNSMDHGTILSKTTKIVIGHKLKENYVDAYNKIKFGQGAVFFELDPFYSYPGKSIYDENQTSIDQLQELYVPAKCLDACVHLLEDSFFGEKTLIKKMKLNKEDVEFLREKYYPVEENDYILFKNCSLQDNNVELLHQVNKEADEEFVIGFVKTNCSPNYRQTAILPYNIKMDEFVKSAFLDERINKFYPYKSNKE
ncbi:MAG: hypothetical protein ACQESC_04135 [Nanobdellota archaeon]